MRRRSLRDLQFWLVGSSGMAADLSSVSSVYPLAPDGWQQRVERGETPDLLLVEGGERLEPAWKGEVEALLDRCEGRIPRLLWITASLLDPAWLRLSSRVDRVFSIDRGHLSVLQAAGARVPSPLWEATALPVDRWPPLDAPRPDAVVWLGGWRREWPRNWRERLALVLEGAAAHGLAIAGVEDPDAFPPDLRQHLSGPGEVDRDATLRRARVVIGADPTCGSPQIAPAVVFDAIARGAAVVTPHGFSYYGAFSILADDGLLDYIPVVRDAPSAAAEVERLLADETLRRNVVRHCRRIVAYNHTYSHRVATLASAAGIRILPDASPRSAPD